MVFLSLPLYKVQQGKNGRKWVKWPKKVHRGYLVGNGFSRGVRHGHRGSQVARSKMVENGRKWVKMVEKKFTAVIW